jgi:hypothetical protein
MRGKIGRLLILCTFIILTKIAYAASPSGSVSADLSPKSSSKNQNTDLLLYLNQVLIDAGFSDDTRKYLMNIAHDQLTNINPQDLPAKTRLLKRNLYIFLNSMSQKCQSPAASDEVRKQYHLADLNPEPWNNILSSTVLAEFKAKHIFESLTVQDIKNCSFTFCQVWPFCED